MMELLSNAWSGWENYTGNGKLAALLLAVLLFLWFYKKKAELKPLILYTTVMTVCCILPVTAALLMMYQTRFYDYVWIWSLVPSTAVTAYGMTLFVAECWGDFKAACLRRGVPVTALLLVVVLLCGGFGGQVRDKAARNEERQKAYAVVEQLVQLHSGRDICLWAPMEIMEYAREADSRIRLPYGRNMWDVSLNGYTYDTYDESAEALYQWMEQDIDAAAGSQSDAGNEQGGQSGSGGKGTAKVSDIVQTALEMGVNCVLIPENADTEMVRELEKAFGASAGLPEGYRVFYERAD